MLLKAMLFGCFGAANAPLNTQPCCGTKTIDLEELPTGPNPLHPSAESTSAAECTPLEMAMVDLSLRQLQTGDYTDCVIVISDSPKCSSATPCSSSTTPCSSSASSLHFLVPIHGTKATPQRFFGQQLTRSASMDDHGDQSSSARVRLQDEEAALRRSLRKRVSFTARSDTEHGAEWPCFSQAEEEHWQADEWEVASRFSLGSSVSPGMRLMIDTPQTRTTSPGF